MEKTIFPLLRMNSDNQLIMFNAISKVEIPIKPQLVEINYDFSKRFDFELNKSIRASLKGYRFLNLRKDQSLPFF